MSDRTTSVASPEAQNTTPVAEQDTGTTPPEQDTEQAPVSGPQDPATLLRAFTAASRAAATNNLVMGLTAIQYIEARYRASEHCTRDAAVRTLTASWQETADRVVGPNDMSALIRQAAAYCVFAGGSLVRGKPHGHQGKLPSGRVLREFSVLLERVTTERTERWIIMPGLQEAATHLWAAAVEKNLAGGEVATATAKLLHQHTAARAQELAAKAAAPDATESDKAAAVKAADAAGKAATKAARADKAADDKPATAGHTAKDGVQAPKPEAATRGQNLLTTLAETAKAGTSRDYAGLLAAAALKADDPLALVHDLAVALFSKAQQPDDMLRAMLDGVKASASLSKPALRAVDSALVLLTAKPAAKAG